MNWHHKLKLTLNKKNSKFPFPNIKPHTNKKKKVKSQKSNISPKKKNYLVRKKWSEKTKEPSIIGTWWSVQRRTGGNKDPRPMTDKNSTVPRNVVVLLLHRSLSLSLFQIRTSLSLSPSPVNRFLSFSGGLSPIASGWVPATFSASSLKSSNSLVSFTKFKFSIFFFLLSLFCFYKVENLFFFCFQIRAFVFCVSNCFLFFFFFFFSFFMNKNNNNYYYKVEPRKQISCSLQLFNKTDNYVAFKVLH